LMHAGRHHHPFLGLTHLSPGTHELELKAVGEHMRPLQTSLTANLETGFRRTLTVIGSETGTGANVSCEFPGDLTETLVLSAAGEASYDVARQNMSVESNTVQIIHPLEGGCLPSKGRLRLSLQYPSSVRSSPGAEDAMVLLIVDGSAVRIPLGARLASCFDVESENMRSLTVDRLYDSTFEPKHHILKVSVVTKDWNVLATSLPVVLVEQSELGNCRETLDPLRVGAGLHEERCLKVAFPRQPSLEMVESIRQNTRRPQCSLNDHIEGIWREKTFIPLYCTIPVLSAMEARACVQNRSIILAGTSVMRGLFYGVLRRLELQTGMGSHLPTSRQASSIGKTVQSNWWRRRAEMSVCPKRRGEGGGLNACRSGCWSCLHEVGAGRVAYLWSLTADSDHWPSVIRQATHAIFASARSSLSMLRTDPPASIVVN
jgi:hypothetical protein